MSHLTCEEVTDALLTLPVPELDRLTSHTDGCPACRVRLADVRTAHEAIEAELDAFAHAVPVDRALVHAFSSLDQGSTLWSWLTHHPWRFPMLATVSLAVLTAILFRSGGTGPAPAETRTLSPIELSPIELSPIERSPIERSPIERSPIENEPELPAEPARKRRPASEVAAEARPKDTKAIDPDCADLTELEPVAMLGRLAADQRACLEGRVQGEASFDASRLLVSDAWAHGDKARWRELAQRHSDTFPDDPEMAFKLALDRSVQGPTQANSVVALSARALAHRTAWTGDQYVKRVGALYKITALARLELWKASGTADNQAAAWLAAREWHDNAQSTGSTTKDAEALCLTLGKPCR